MGFVPRRAILLVMLALSACKGEERDPKVERPRPTTTTTTTSTAAPTVEVVASAAPPGLAPARPRYLRPNAQGVLVDAYRFPSVPASMVESEVKAVTTRRGVAAILHRFGVNPPADRGGEVWMEKASLVDGLARERLLVVSFRGDVDDQGSLDEDDWLVFLGSTEEDRLIGLGSEGISAKTHDGAPIAIDLRTLHSTDVDDVVATWSTCATPLQKTCHGLRAWSMQRGYPERIVDVVCDTEATIGGTLSPPYDVACDGRVLKFDPQTFAYR